VRVNSTARDCVCLLVTVCELVCFDDRQLFLIKLMQTFLNFYRCFLMLATIMRDECHSTPLGHGYAYCTPYPLTPVRIRGRKKRLYRFVATFGICVTIIVLNSALNVLN